MSGLPERRGLRLLIFGVPILLAWIAIFWVLRTPVAAEFLSGFDNNRLETSAKLGDTFGAFSALMAAFAALGAILALAEQRAAVRRQMFISTLTAMLDRLQQTIADTDYFVVQANENSDGTVEEQLVETQSGQSAFYEISQELRFFIKENTIEGMRREEIEGLIVLLYPGFYESYKHDLGHFFRQLYHIVKYVHESGDNEKERFIKIVRASLTNAQLLLLAYNVIAGEGRVKFSFYIERYSLLHNLGFEIDDLGSAEESLIRDRLGEKALVSDTQKQDRLKKEFLDRERRNSFAKTQLRRFLDERGYQISPPVSWKNPK